eukprot:GFKZ01007401.1.p1 GENE.GFKZ01007401.1~~GFKZ01007401.1.p1  ORF type:complete len:207 (-),score=18.06 GFKZ01007401.1:131-751(-)
MLAFVPAVRLPIHRLAPPLTLRRPTAIPLASLSAPEEDVPIRFNRGLDSLEPKRSFFPSTSSSETLPTPNERVLAQVRDSMRRLGIQDPENLSPAPSSTVPIDISRVNPFSAFLGAGGASVMSYAAWASLIHIITFFVSHPLTDEIYVVQRITAVVRTCLVCLFALGSGISGVTALGLFLLGLRTSFAAVTGEFRNPSADAKDSTL